MNLSRILLAASLLALLSVACGGSAETTSTSTTVAPITTTTAASTTPPAPIVIRVEGGAVVEGPEVVSVSQGDTVSVVVEGDASDEIHVHGYDLTFALEPGEPTTVEFVADATGIFEIELHDSGGLLTELEVSP